MATIITADNSTAVLAQLAEQQERMAETIEGVIDQLADQTLRSDRHDEQLRMQAAALRSTAAQLSRTIADVAKVGPNSNSGNPGNGNSSNGKPNANGNPGNERTPEIVGAAGEVSAGPLEIAAKTGAGTGGIQAGASVTPRRRWI